MRTSKYKSWFFEDENIRIKYQFSYKWENQDIKLIPLLMRKLRYNINSIINENTNNTYSPINEIIQVQN